MSEQVTGSPKSSAREKEEENHIPLEGEQLTQAIRKQIEYYFSKENLQQDAFLTSHMDANMSVPIAVIMKFSKIRALTHDEDVIIKSLEGSSVSVVDGRIKANVKSGGRSTIILRDIPSDAPEEEVKEIFAYDGAKHVLSLRSDIGDTWFVVMDSEEDAKDTLIDLRLKKRTFRGQPVKGRMKSETMVRSFYPVQTAPVAFGGMPFGFPAPVGMGYGYGMMPNGMGLPQPPMLSTENMPNNNIVASSAPVTDDKESDSSPSSGDKAKKAVTAASAASVQQKTAGATAAPANNREAPNNSNIQRRQGTSAPVNGVKPAAAGSADGKDKKAGSGSRTGTTGTNPAAKKDAKSPGAQVEITPANFPPLQAGQEDTAIPTPGYKTTFIKYTFDDVINIVKSVQEATLPETIKPAEHPLSMTVAPNMDLLQRQRTFSIDETREQLRQGRPVQQMAVASSSAGDYGSMMYGDGYASDGQQGVSAAVTKKAAASSAPPKKPSTGSWAGIVATPAAAQPPLPAPSATTASQQSASGAAGASSSAAANNSSWKRGDKVPAPAEKAPAGKSPEKKPAASAAGEKGEKGRKGETKPKKDSKPREEKEGAKEEGVEKAEVPSSWGGKPTFANILKTQQESEGSSPDAGVNSPTPAASNSSSAAHGSPKKSVTHSSEGHNSERKERRGDRGHNESRGGGSGSGRPRGEGREKKDNHGGHGKGKEGSQ